MQTALWNNSTASIRGLRRDATGDGSELEPFGKEVDEAIKAHAIEAFPNECCGVVADGKYIRCTNISKQPTASFEIAEDEYLQISANIQAVAHSHPKVMPYPTAWDMEQQMLMDVPWAIASVTSDGDNPPYCMDLFWWGDSLPRLPLVGRVFRPGAQDCFALVRDYYKEKHGIELGDFPRDHAWWQPDDEGNPRKNLFEDFFSQSGFIHIDVKDLRPGDGFACPYGTTVMSHCGVFVEGEKALHHLSNSISKMEPAAKWVRRTLQGGRFFRPKALDTRI